MKTLQRWTFVIGAAVTLGAVTGSARSAPVRVDADYQGKHWATAFTNVVNLAWEWKTNAAYARLDIAGMSETFTTNFTQVTSNYLWRAFPSTAPSEEDVYDLTLAFYGAGGAVVGAQTSRLSVVKGAFEKIEVDAMPEGSAWPHVKENAVVPYDAGWTKSMSGATTGRLVIARAGGSAQTNALADATGYFGWKIRKSGWGYGTFNLALSFPDTVTNVWDATLVRPLDGTLIRMQ